MRVIQFTDTHLLPDPGLKLHDVDTYDALRRSVETALRLKPSPDIIIVTGDIAEDGSIEAYRRFKTIFAAITIPVIAVPGNHDDPESMVTAFRDSNIAMASSVTWKHWNGIFVDSTVRGKSHGYIDESKFVALERALQQSEDRPVMLSLHHPPLSGCPSSGCQLQNGAELVSLLSQYKNVKLLISGHLHQDFEINDSHFKIFTSPSTFAQGRHPTLLDDVDFEDFWASHSLDVSRHGFRIIDLMPSGEFKTETHYYNASL